MTASAIARIFELPAIWSALVAGAIELVGVSVNSYYLEAAEFNADLERHRERYDAKTYKARPENVRAAQGFVVAFYVVTGGIVAGAAIYEALTETMWLKLLAVLFPVASALGTITMNRRAALHRKRASLIAESAARSAAHSESSESSERTSETSAAHSDAGSNGKRLECPYCGAQSNSRGDPFKTPQAISAHLAYCEQYQRQQASEGANA
jgi:hypothetical protein